MLFRSTMAIRKRNVIQVGAGGAATLAPGGMENDVVVKARGYWEQVWLRFRRDRMALAGGIFIVALVVIAYAGSPVAAHFLGHGPNDQFPGTSFTPLGPLAHLRYQDPITSKFSTVFLILGTDDPTLGRDEFLRLLYGAQVSLEVAVGAMLISMLIGVTLGSIAGFFRGWIDTIISRLNEITMAFPLLLFMIALASTIGDKLNGITLGFLGKGVFTLVFVIGVFGWYYPARIVRAQVLSLREKEFVEAARMTGASDLRIIRSHLLPHLVAVSIVYATLIIAQNVLLEAGLSFLGVGIQLPTASWGNMLQQSVQFYQIQPLLMIWPGLAILFTTLAFNLLGDGLRDAFDPRAQR